MASNYAKMSVALYLWIACLCIISFQIGADSTDRCPPRLTRGMTLRTVGEKCYQFVRTEMFWEDARNYCRRKGGDLITITSREIQGMVERAMYEFWANNGMWIGASDSHDEMDWRWVTGERIGYSNWDSNQPRCFLPDFMCHEDCAVVRKDKKYKWHDYLCAAQPYTYGFACQFDMLPITTKAPTTVPTTTLTTTTLRKMMTSPITQLSTVKTTSYKTAESSSRKTTRKTPSTSHLPVQVTNASISVIVNPENMMKVESQRMSSMEGGMETGSVVGLVISFFIVFLAGLIIGIVMCRRRYRRKYSEEVSAGFNNVLYTPAPRVPNSDRVKETNVMVAVAACGGDDDDDDDAENEYSSIDEVLACAKNVNLPTAKEIKDCGSNEQHTDNHYETVPSDLLEMGGASEHDAPPPYPCNFTGFQPEFLKKDTDVSQAYSNNLYGYK